MHPLMLGIEILTLVPNNLSTQQNYQSSPSITNPKSTKPQKNTPKIKKPHQKWRGSEKESGGEKEMGEKKGSGEVER